MIRKINNLDRMAIYEILKKEFHVNYKEDTPFSNWYIYELNREIAGFINIDIIYDKAEIEYIYVINKYRNQKIATKLLQYVEKNLKQKKVNNITLEVNENNKKAISFYVKNGFKKVAIRKNYYRGEDAFLMLKEW